MATPARAGTSWPTSTGSLRFVGAVLAVVLVLGVTIIGSPLLLIAINDVTPNLPWDRLSEIGQSYSGIAALFSAFALLGVAGSIVLQLRQNRLQQLQTVREMQINLLTLPFSTPMLRQVLVPEDASEEATEKAWRAIYLNLFMRYIEYAFLVGELTADGLLRVLTSEVFSRLEGREYWANARAAWMTERPRDPKRAEFLVIADEAFRRAHESST
jgi:hypothetical protein